MGRCVTLVLSLLILPQAQALEVTALKCDHAANPLGVDVAQPRLSWQVAEPDAAVMRGIP